VALALAPPAHTQTPVPSEAPPLRASLDATPSWVPRKRTDQGNDVAVPAGVWPLPKSDAGVGQLADFADQPSIGIGSTGFDSSNLRRKPVGKAKPARPTAAAAGPDAAAISRARLAQTQNQTRPGVPKTDAMANAAPTAPPSGPSALPAPTAPDALAPELPRTLIRRPVPDEAPFDPTGISAGAFVLRPAVETSGGYDSNPARTTAGGRASLFGIVAPELKLNSTWARHELTADLRGSYITYATTPQFDRPDFNGKIDGRVDVTSHTQLNLESRLIISTDNPGTPNFQAGLARLPIFTDAGGSIGLGQRFNRLDVSLKGSFDRTMYQQSVLTDGTTQSNDDRNFDQLAAQLRANYELTPGVKPFAEVDVDHRAHDLQLDRSGLERDSQGSAARIGTSFELSRILTGELAFGYLSRTYRDPTLPAVSGPTIDGSLVWLATALTTVKLTASTIASETTIAGVSGIFTHEVGLEVDHSFRRWLLGTLKFTTDRDDYVGSPRIDYRYAGSAALTYMLTRELQIRSELRREWLASNQPGNDYAAYVALLGLRLQR
jgi:hypothetical protein